jgi:hypothetical protein
LVHIKEEEEEILPQFKNAISLDRLMELGKQFVDNKSKVPTHPHPSAPTTYPLNVVADKMAATLDKAKDTIAEERK